jgi:hypothetical protein
MKLKNLIIFLLASVILGGCLKTNPLYEGFEDIKPLADIPLSHLSTDTLTPYVMSVAATPDATIDTVVAVHLSAKNHVGDVTFQLGLGDQDSAFKAYLKAHPDFELCPPELYSFDPEVTIQNAGVLNTANFKVSFKTGAVDADGNNLFLSHNYLLPIIIKDAGGYQIASNFRMIIMRPLAANEWAGNYIISGILGGPNAYTGSDLGGPNSLSTVNGTTVAEFDIGNFFGGYTEYTFNQDGTISVAALDSQGGGSYGAVVTESGYDKATHNFHVTFSILGGKYIFPLTYTRQ